LKNEKKIKAKLDQILPEFSITMGGAFSIDLTKPGIDRGYDLKKLAQVLSLPISKMIFIGDALFKVGNDHPARKRGWCVHV
jgi:hypothetical protein